MLAMWQLGKAEPISTFPGWKRVGRNVRKGEKAIALLMPVTGRKIDEESGEEQRRMFFVSRKKLVRSVPDRRRRIHPGAHS